jgi:hypothetical protein
MEEKNSFLDISFLTSGEPQTIRKNFYEIAKEIEKFKPLLQIIREKSQEMREPLKCKNSFIN